MKKLLLLVLMTLVVQALPNPSGRGMDGKLRLDLPGRDVEVLQNQAEQALLKVNMREHRRLKLKLDFDATPSGWSVNLGDSPSNNGYGGDAGQFSNDAEVQLLDEGLSVYGSDLLGEGSHLFKSWAVKIRAGQSMIWEIADGEFVCQGVGELRHPALFALAGQPDREGQVNYDLFIGLNRVVGGGRSGSGLAGATLWFE